MLPGCRWLTPLDFLLRRCQNHPPLNPPPPPRARETAACSRPLPCCLEGAAVSRELDCDEPLPIRVRVFAAFKVLNHQSTEPPPLSVPRVPLPLWQRTSPPSSPGSPPPLSSPPRNWSMGPCGAFLVPQPSLSLSLSLSPPPPLWSCRPKAPAATLLHKSVGGPRTCFGAVGAHTCAGSSPPTPWPHHSACRRARPAASGRRPLRAIAPRVSYPLLHRLARSETAPGGLASVPPSPPPSRSPPTSAGGATWRSPVPHPTLRRGRAGLGTTPACRRGALGWSFFKKIVYR